MAEPGAQHDRPQTGTAPGDLGWALAVLLRRWHEAAEFVLSDLPEGSRGYHVLSAVAERDLPTQAALAAHLGIDRTVMTYVLDTLESAGLVERVPAPGDRRARRIVATEHGRSVLAGATRRVTRAQQAVLAALDDTEQDLLGDLAHRAALYVRADSPHIDPCDAIRTVLAADGLGPDAPR
ncbi:MarR family winged helix-turn-helix transcriptional regulator [Nocardiopsis composta]|uniref:DNA-binding MarR family transcriptional regulator n=1 Tax=Nocardiopsis composta TaxID=157465 RepID=A0A7W8QHB8_9ACTN|nr:MarR family transcriptional regulator [Nocardiopsis composta]MBB5430234.1 DNA-binding MarR family transcriptional regulator [Nocardiopsis composta]